MPIVNEIHGDIIQIALENEFYDGLIHGANCFNTMGAGVAKLVKDNFQNAWYADQRTIAGDRRKLGRYSIATEFDKDGDDFLVINAYTQYKTGPNADYDAVRSVFKSLDIDFGGDVHLLVPLIGCGIGGLDWDVVKNIIHLETPNLMLTVVHYKP